MALLACMQPDREGKRAGYLNLLRDHCSMFTNWMVGEKGVAVTLTFGGGAFGMHASR